MILKDGVLSIMVPKPVRTSVGLKLHLEDSKNHYLPVHEYHVIPVDSSIKTNQTYWSEEIILLTKDGKSCIGEANPD